MTRNKRTSVPTKPTKGGAQKKSASRKVRRPASGGAAGAVPAGASHAPNRDHGKRSTAERDRFPVVALGASAGGLAALQQFFESVPEDSGMAFVIITHQAPDRTTMLPELLSKRALIPIVTASEGMKLVPNQGYVAPPGNSLVVRDESLYLQSTDGQRAAALPIDLAFRSLAQNEGDQAIAIVLSGNGSDGSLGIAEVKAAYGMVMAQEPATAQYPGMPSSAIATKLVDYVLPPAQMAEQLNRYIHGQRQQVSQSKIRIDDPQLDGALQKILSLLRARTGSDFGAYKKSTIRRRIARRMHVHGLADPQDYARFLERAPHEADALFKELLISVTSFFRDVHAFEVIEHELLKLIELKDDGNTLRMWIAGCATGEEAYSIAIATREALERSGKDFKIQIFATDLDQQAVEVARSGRYPDGITADIGPERLKRFFTREENGYRVNKEVRELIVFAVQNVIKDPPFTKLDLLSCRNLLIYLEPELQKRVLGLFSYSLRVGGLLLLGTSESVSGFDDRFATLDKRWKLFQRLQSSTAQALPDFFAERTLGTGVEPGQRGARGGRQPPGVAHVAERMLLASFVPPSVILSERGELIYVQGRVGHFLEPSPGEPTQNVFGMAREGLRAELPAAVRHALTSKRPIVRRGLQVKTNGGYSNVTLTVLRLVEPEALRGTFLASFELSAPAEEATKAREHKPGKSLERVKTIEQELQRTRENLQGMIEELETSNEELKSTNEELQSTNEELQSANEELETSREEMQSLNEELQTVNSELEERNRALSQANDDMQNLLNSTDVATLFLDDKLNIKRFTKQARKVFNLIDSDVGRPIADLAANLRYGDLIEDAREVMSTLVFREREVQTTEGSWRLMRIMPYRTHENLIDGLVTTFVDIDRLKLAQRAEQQARAVNELILDSIKPGLLVLGPDQRVLSANNSLCAMFSTEPKRVVGRLLQELDKVAPDLPVVGARFAAMADTMGASEEGVARIGAQANGKRITVTAKRLPDQPERPGLVLLMFENESPG